MGKFYFCGLKNRKKDIKMIHTKSRLLTTLIVSLFLLFLGNMMANDRYRKQKVVYHINYDNPKAQAGALRNIQNHINAVGVENLDVKVVMHGKGLSLLLDPDALKNTKLDFANANENI